VAEINYFLGLGGRAAAVFFTAGFALVIARRIAFDALDTFCPDEAERAPDIEFLIVIPCWC